MFLSFTPFFLFGKEYRENEAYNTIQQVINLQQLAIENWFYERASDVHTISQLPTVKELEKERIEEILYAFNESHPEFDGIVFVNKEGISEIDTSAPAGINISDRLYFHEAKQGRSYVSDVLIGRQSNKDIIIFSSPIFDYKNQFQGLIFGSIRLDMINGVMKKFRFSNTGQTYIVNRDGQVLTDLRFPTNALLQGTKSGFIEKINTDIFDLAIQGKKVTSSYMDYRGLKVFGHYRWINDGKWLIIGEIAEHDVYTPFNQMMKIILATMIIVFLIGLFIIIKFTNQVDRVIQVFLDVSRQMVRAKYEYRIEPSIYEQYTYEFKELCETFNRMAGTIQYQIRSLQKSEERYRALVVSSPNAIIVLQDGKIIFANPKSVELFKASTREDLLGQNMLYYIHDDFQEIVTKRIKLLENNTPVGLLEEKYVLLDGTILDVEVIATPVEYMDRPAIQVIIQDISSRKEMERKLYKSQEQYRSVVENLKEVIFQTDKQGYWTFLNPAWREITGFTIEESVGKPVIDYVHPDDRKHNNQLLQLLIGRKEDYCRYEIRYLTKDGGFRWIEVYARLTLDDQGQIIGTSGTLNDVTERKEAEEELRASEEQFRLIAESTSDMITLHDFEGNYVYASPACKEILQYEEAELVGQNAFLFIHPDDHAVCIKSHQATLKTGSSVVAYRIRRKDGEYLWLESSAKLLQGSQIDETKLIVVSRNINQRKLAEQKLQEANEILQRLSAIDGLTGVANRRAFDERLEWEWNRSLRSSTPLSLIMFDIDFFKAYNDTYGHQGGDGCLKRVASTINDTLERSTDLLCRYGGEEFSVILPDTDSAGARIVGEKIRSVIEGLEIPHSGSKISPWVTISVGTATIIPNLNSTPFELISFADKAAYQAKREGRNCVCSYD